MKNSQDNTTLQEIHQIIFEHLEERDWHNNPPRGLAISIAIEAAELLEHYQWQDTPADKQEIANELADVLIYCFQLAAHYDINIAQAIADKLKISAQKYPAHQFKDQTPEARRNNWQAAHQTHRQQKQK